MAKIVGTFKYTPNPNFIGRERDLARLEEIGHSKKAQIVVVHGRRRVGKTTLIQEAFRERSLLKFEGLEGKPDAEQRTHFLEQLSIYAGDPKLAKLSLDSWKEVFMVLAECVSKGRYTIFLEELQWMANYRQDLVSDLKFVWDNYLNQNNQLVLVLCGSSPSFIISAVMHSKALYNRSQHEFPIKELDIESARTLLGTGISEDQALDAYLLVGGIPEYLQYLHADSSVYLSLVKESFCKGGFFVDEASRVFVSSLAKNPTYKQVIELLANHGPSTRKILAEKLKLRSGGTLSSTFEDLERCGFVFSYGPLAYGDSSRDSKLMLSDNYLHFYYCFIHRRLKSIKRGDLDRSPATALTHAAYRQWLGYSLERFCIKEHRRLASILGFNAVEYDVGPFYLRGKASDGLQIDLMFRRKDKVFTICEVKYTDAPVTKSVIASVERKLALLPEKRRYGIQKVLISPNGASPELVGSGYFDRVIRLEDLSSLVNRLS